MDLHIATTPPQSAPRSKRKRRERDRGRGRQKGGKRMRRDSGQPSANSTSSVASSPSSPLSTTASIKEQQNQREHSSTSPSQNVSSTPRKMQEKGRLRNRPKERPPSSNASSLPPNTKDSGKSSSPASAITLDRLEKDKGSKGGKDHFVEDATSFEGLGICERVRTALASMKISNPTRVQQACLPVLLQGKDVFIHAKTGSGKTLAFLLPIAEHLLRASATDKITRDQGSRCIIVSPTHELCSQIEEVAKALFRPFPFIVVGSVLGGESKKKEKARLRRGVTVLIGTPGRLADHMQNTASFKTSMVDVLCLDEADRLLDLGFKEALETIVTGLDQQRSAASSSSSSSSSSLSSSRQTILASATLNAEVKRLMEISLKRPKVISTVNEQDYDSDDDDSAHNNKKMTKTKDEDGAIVKAGDLAVSITIDKSGKFSVPDGLVQSFCLVPLKRRLITLASFLRGQSQRKHCKVIVFVATGAQVAFYHALLSQLTVVESGQAEGEEEDLIKCPLIKLFGGMPQAERAAAFAQFRQKKSSILVCTDVAARGLDVPDVAWVVQYDAPTEVAEYVHRVGRTARLRGSGHSLLFLNPTEREYASLLSRKGLKLREITPESVESRLQVKSHLRRDEGGSFLVQKRLEDEVESSSELKRSAVTAYHAFLSHFARSDLPHKPIPQASGNPQGRMKSTTHDKEQRREKGKGKGGGKDRGKSSNRGGKKNSRGKGSSDGVSGSGGKRERQRSDSADHRHGKGGDGPESRNKRMRAAVDAASEFSAGIF